VVLAAALLSACSSAPTPASPSASAAPAGQAHTNILLIIADDFGVDASPCYEIGAEKPHMPNLEALCNAGLVFDNVWVNPQCSPSRATFLTGRYGFRTGVLTAGTRLPPTQSIQQVVTDLHAGYANALFGKWHLGGDPAAFGVEHYAAFLEHAELADYFNWSITEDGKPKDFSEYATSAFTDMSIDWIKAQREPWFLWLAYNAPHAPFHLPPDDLHTRHGLSGKAEDIAANPREYYFAMAEAMDTEMGRLLDSMSAAVRNNTVIIFVGDNGTPPEVIQAPFELSRGKATVYQGGISVPLVVAGRGVTRHGEREKALINGTDLFATIAQLAGDPRSEIHDSISFADAFKDPGFEGRTHAYTEFRSDEGTMWAARDKRYKLITFGDGRKALFDLASDPFEKSDLNGPGASAEVKSVIAELDTYHSGLLAKQ
jgi:arylsulfatase B